MERVLQRIFHYPPTQLQQLAVHGQFCLIYNSSLDYLEASLRCHITPHYTVEGTKRLNNLTKITELEIIKVRKQTRAICFQSLYLKPLHHTLFHQKVSSAWFPLGPQCPALGGYSLNTGYMKQGMVSQLSVSRESLGDVLCLA